MQPHFLMLLGTGFIFVVGVALFLYAFFFAPRGTEAEVPAETPATAGSAGA